MPLKFFQNLVFTLFAFSIVLILARIIIDFGQPIITDDIWWHIKLGQVFLSEMKLPDVEPLLFTSTGQSQFYQEWLFEIIVAFVEGMFGIDFLRVLHLFLSLGILFSVFLLSKKTGFSNIISIIIVLCVLFFAYQRLIQLRPHLFSIMFFDVVFGLTPITSLI